MRSRLGRLDRRPYRPCTRTWTASPTPVTSQLDGVRVKLNYDKYADVIANVVIDGKKLSEIAEIKKSFMYDYILVKINSESSLVEDSN